MLDEITAFYLLLAGIVVAAIAYLWLIGAGFRIRWPWGVGLILCPPVVLAFIPRHFRKVRLPTTLLVVGCLLCATPLVANWILGFLPIDLGPRRKLVEGEIHLTLTGWDRQDYAQVLRDNPEVVVLQMANPDVTDETLTALTDLKQLRELDVSDSAITDQGLVILAKLPALRQLRLARTAISDEGFSSALLELQTLDMLDLTGTKVSGKLKRQWKKGKPDRRILD